MTFSIVRADPRTVEVALGLEVDLPAIAVLGVDDGAVKGSGGLAWGGGRCWIWFSMTETKPAYALPIIRETKRMLRRAAQLGEREVFTPRDADKPQSMKLLMLLGFEPVETMMIRGEPYDIWRWSVARG